MYFPDPVIFEIPVLPRVRKFLNVHLAGQPLMATPDNALYGLFLWSMAQAEKVRMVAHYRRSKLGTERVYYQPEYSARLGVGISEFHGSRAQMLLNQAEVSVFSEYIGWSIQHEFLQQSKHSKLTLPALIRSFTAKYDFSEDDMTEESLRQLFWRHRRQAKLTVIRPDTTLVTPAMGIPA